MAKIPRVRIYTSDEAYKGELNPEKLTGLVVISEINGEMAMQVTTLQALNKNDRLLYRDGRGRWHEYVVQGISSPHDTPAGPLHTYYCPWSLQCDLEGTTVTGMPGTGGTPATAAQALDAALAGTQRWQVDDVTIGTTGSASFWRLSGWEAMQKLVEVWGGEVIDYIEVLNNGTISRYVSLTDHVGLVSPSRRFDYGSDMSAITKTVSDQLWTSRVIPLGAGEETDSGGYGRKITIESVNNGVAYLENTSVRSSTRVKYGNDYEYPVQTVENSECKTPADLKAWALAHLEEWTTPKVSYEADVVQLARAGLDPQGVSIGDAVIVVDKTFQDGGLRISTRVMRIEEDLLDPSATVLTISNLQDSLATTLDSLSKATSDVYGMVTGMSENQSSVQWVSELLARINAEANATGGYTYITEGEGIRCYDHAVTDPLVGAEASAVCEVKGGTIRIANTKDSGGNWQWKTVFVSGRILAELIDAIGSSSGYHAQLTPTGLDVYNGATVIAHFGANVTLGDSSSPMAIFDSDHLSLLAAWRSSASVGDRAYIALASGCTLEVEIGGTRDITRLISGGPLYLYGYDGVYAQSDNGGSQESANLAMYRPLRIDVGEVDQSQSIAANSYRDYNVTFDSAFGRVPNVQLTIYTTSTATTFDCDIYLRSVSTTGFTARIFNRESTSRSPGFRWQATIG